MKLVLLALVLMGVFSTLNPIDPFDITIRAEATIAANIATIKVKYPTTQDSKTGTVGSLLSLFMCNINTNLKMIFYQDSTGAVAGSLKFVTPTINGGVWNGMVTDSTASFTITA